MLAYYDESLIEEDLLHELEHDLENLLNDEDYSNLNGDYVDENILQELQHEYNDGDGENSYEP